MGYLAEPVAVTPEVSEWFSSEGVDDLSQQEASILAAQWAAELDKDDVVPAPQRLIEPLTDALLKAFRVAARTGAVDHVQIEGALLRSVLDEHETENVLRWIEQRLGTRPAE